jgi:hypothetical protein
MRIARLIFVNAALSVSELIMKLGIYFKISRKVP